MGRRPEETFLYKGHTDGQCAYAKMFKITSCLRNAIQNYNEISPHTGQNGYRQKNPQTANSRDGVERREPSYSCWWECKLEELLWRTVWRLLKKLKIELPYEPTIPLLGISSVQFSRSVVSDSL